MIFDAAWEVNFSKFKWFDQQPPPFGPENIRQATFMSTRGVRLRKETKNRYLRSFL